MKRLFSILRRREGETLVEVMCAGMIFLIALAALHGAVRFAHGAGNRSLRIRGEVLELQRSLREEETVEASGAAEYVFYPLAPDGTRAGEEAAFTVTVGLGSREVYREGKEAVTFSVFLPGTGEGGGP